MKEVIKVSENVNYSAVNIGELSKLSEYSLFHAKLNIELNKVFVKEPTKATGTEISFHVLPAHTEIPYFHSHKQNEETYIVLSGEGYFQVDDDCFPISEGSVVRIAPAGKRGFSNTSDQSMTVICIQAKENSLEQYTAQDGKIENVEPLWRNIE